MPGHRLRAARRAAQQPRHEACRRDDEALAAGGCRARQDHRAGAARHQFRVGLFRPHRLHAGRAGGLPGAAGRGDHAGDHAFGVRDRRQGAPDRRAIDQRLLRVKEQRMAERQVERVRHELRFRIAEVVRNERITPRMARITLTSPDFEGFRSDAYDDHVKLFFAPPGESLAMPTPGANGLVFPEGAVRPEARDYTPRRFDRARREVVIDFVLHGDGPAASWAARAASGDTVGVGGPRASFVVRGEFDWYLLVGDETALPAIARRIEELPSGARVMAFVEVADAAERQQFETAAALELHWLLRDDPGAPKLVE